MLEKMLTHGHMSCTHCGKQLGSKGEVFEEIEKEREETIIDRTLALPGPDPDRPRLVSGFDSGQESQVMTGPGVVKDRTHEGVSGHVEQIMGGSASQSDPTEVARPDSV
jgi:hypothetical protein